MKPIDKLLLILLGVMMPIALYFAFIYAPREMVMGEVQRIFYFHVSSNWTTFLATFFVFLYSILFLMKGTLFLRGRGGRGGRLAR